MANVPNRPTPQGSPDHAASVPEDARKPYEAPRLLKKRSIACATLFTAHGAISAGLTAHG